MCQIFYLSISLLLQNYILDSSDVNGDGGKDNYLDTYEKLYEMSHTLIT